MLRSTDKARLYYELHITCEAGENFERFKVIAERLGWRASRFDQDDVDDYHGKWFMSAREAVWGAVEATLRSTLAILAINGIEVIRWKAEDTLLDSKHGDELP